MTAVLTLPGVPRDEPAEHDSLFFVGNATVLIRCGGFTILTDPTFVHRHESVSIGYGMSTTRLTDPALDVADLPPLDLVLLSHFHGDHFDQVAERELDRDLPIVTTGQAAGMLQERGFRNTLALQTWQDLEVRRGEALLRITACPGRHGPGVTDLALPDVMGSVLEFAPDGGRVTRRLYVSGDTLLYDDLEEIPRRFPDIDVGLFHLGGTTVLGIMVTMDAEQGVGAVDLIGADTALPIHYDDYDVFTSGLEDFVEEARRRGLADRVHPWGRGDTFSL